MTETMTLKMGTFEPMAFDEVFAVDGGKSTVGQAIGFTGGAVAFSWGTMITIVGLCTLNPAVAGIGFGLACGGVGTMAGNI